MPLIFLFFGAVFGFLLSRARATDYAAMVDMFRLVDLHLMGVIAVAIATAACGLALLRRAGGVALAAKPARPGVFVGGIVFGVGWALAGACPGTALAQLGEGKLYALATIGGILAGTWWFTRRSAARSTIGPVP